MSSTLGALWSKLSGITLIVFPDFMQSGVTLEMIGWFCSYFLLLNIKVPTMIMATSKMQTTRMLKYSG